MKQYVGNNKLGAYLPRVRSPPASFQSPRLVDAQQTDLIALFLTRPVGCLSLSETNCKRKSSKKLRKGFKFLCCCCSRCSPCAHEQWSLDCCSGSPTLCTVQKSSGVIQIQKGQDNTLLGRNTGRRGGDDYTTFPKLY